MSKYRSLLFAFGLAIAAAPLVWMGVDPLAGEKLLRWTAQSPGKPMASTSTPTPSRAQRY
jgi:hypothetical protein